MYCFILIVDFGRSCLLPVYGVGHFYDDLLSLEKTYKKVHTLSAAFFIYLIVKGTLLEVKLKHWSFKYCKETMT